MSEAFDRLRAAGFGGPYACAIVTGTGLGGLAALLDERVGLAYAEIPGFPATGVIATDLLERELDNDRNALRRDGSQARADAVTLTLRPFELVTLRFHR